MCLSVNLTRPCLGLDCKGMAYLTVKVALGCRRFFDNRVREHHTGLTYKWGFWRSIEIERFG